MASVVGLNDLSQAVIDAGKNLLNHHSSTDGLLTLLDGIESLLTNVEQDPVASMQSALRPLMNALVSADLLKHPDSDVRVSVVSCLTEVMRITAPEAPYSDDQMKEIFQMTVEAFDKLADVSSRSYRKAKVVLDTVSNVRLCLVMLDLECDDLILQMFQKFLKIISSDHPQVVFLAMELIMITVIDETEEVSRELLDILLATVRKEKQNVSPVSWSLVEKVLTRCASKVKPCIIEALKSTGTSLDMYSPVVLSICQSKSDTTKAQVIVNTKENKAKETGLDIQVTPIGSGKDIQSKSSSKRPASDRTQQTDEADKDRNRNSSSLLKQSESADAETEPGTSGKRGRKPNSRMNPEEGYDHSWVSGKGDSLKMSSSKNLQKRRSSLGKVAAKKTPLPKETSTFPCKDISSPATSRALTGSLKRSRVKKEEKEDDSDSLSSPRSKTLASCVQDEESPESNKESFEKSEDVRKSGRSSNKRKTQNYLEKTAKKKPIVEAKMVTTSGKRSVHSDAKKKNSESASLGTPVTQSSKRKKMASQSGARLLAEESEETPTSHPKGKRTARKEVESNMELGGNLVGKRVNIWWPLDKTFYEGVIESYISRKKMHRVLYTDGDSEELDLKKERWEFIDDSTCAIEDKETDLPETIPLSDIIQRQKAKKSKVVEQTSSSDNVKSDRSSSRKLRKDFGKNLNKRVKGRSKAVSKEGEAGEGKNYKSLKDLKSESERRTEDIAINDQEVIGDVNHENEKVCSDEKQEEAGDECEESVTSLTMAETEGETKKEEEQCPNAEAESEREDSEFAEEPKWRDTEAMDEEDNKGTNTDMSVTGKEEPEAEEAAKRQKE